MTVLDSGFHLPLAFTCILVALSFPALAQSDESSAESPGESPPRAITERAADSASVSLRITGSALKPRENDVSFTVGIGGGACSYVTAGDESTVWNHAVTLPQGSPIVKVRMYYYDASISDSSAWLTVYDSYGAIVEEWAMNTLGRSGYGFSDSALINHQVDYSAYSYLLNWRPGVTGSTVRLCGFEIFSSLPNDPVFTDDFESGDTSSWN